MSLFREGELRRIKELNYVNKKYWFMLVKNVADKLQYNLSHHHVQFKILFPSLASSPTYFALCSFLLMFYCVYILYVFNLGFDCIALMSCLRCQSFHNVAPLTVAMQVEVVLTGRVIDHGPHLDTGVTHPADTVINSQSHPKCEYLSLM